MSSSSVSMCEDITTVVPRSTASAIRRVLISSRASGSRSAIGSSSRRSSGRLPKARAKASRVRWPPESVPTRASIGTLPERTMRCAAAASQSGFSSAPIRSVSATVNRLNSGLSCPRKAILGRTPGSSTGTPKTWSPPVLGRTWRVASPSSVLLPAPFGPTRPQMRPAGIRKEQSRSAQPRR